MSPHEMQILIEGKRSKYIGNMHEDEVERLEIRRKELEDQGITVL